MDTVGYAFGVAMVITVVLFLLALRYEPKGPWMLPPLILSVLSALGGHEEMRPGLDDFGKTMGMLASSFLAASALWWLVGLLLPRRSPPPPDPPAPL